MTDAFQNRAKAAGLTPALVREVIAAFYEAVRRDDVLGPVFEQAMGDDWGPHIERICSFWLTATRLGSGYDARNFMPAHMKHASIRQEHVPRWLHLFNATLDERCTPQAAAALADIARRMAESIQLGLSRRDGAAVGSAKSEHPTSSAPSRLTGDLT